MGGWIPEAILLKVDLISSPKKKSDRTSMAAAGITTTTSTSHCHYSQSSLLFHPSKSNRLSFSVYNRSPIPIPIRISRSFRADAVQLPPSLVTDPIPVSKLGEEIDGGGGGVGGGSGNSGGGGGGGGDRWEGGEEEDKDRNTGGKMSMSQKLTLVYAVLVGVGGFMGYMKSGSLKSVAAGGFSALVLYYVYTQLPVRPAFASSLGLGISAALLGVMGSRFKRSKKIFPAGVVSVVSFVMVGGYFHGILRSLHA